VYYFLPDKKLLGLRAERMTLCFVALDIASFIVQIGGGLMTLSKNFNTLNNGLHIYTAGVALQEFFILCFLFLVYKFERRLRVECSDAQKAEARRLLLALYITLGLITYRIVFRIVEFSAGAGTGLTNQFRSHEWYQYVFDAAAMFLALVAMNVFHPGKVLIGKESEFKSRKERKLEKRQSKERAESSDGGLMEMGNRST